MEPLYKLLERKNYKRAIEWAYQEILTRLPATEELADAQLILKTGGTPEGGMADLCTMHGPPTSEQPIARNAERIAQARKEHGTRSMTLHIAPDGLRVHTSQPPELSI